MDFNNLPRRPMPRRKEEEGCKVEVRKSKNGKKIIISKGCTKEQIQMLKESGQLNTSEIENASS